QNQKGKFQGRKIRGGKSGRTESKKRSGSPNSCSVELRHGDFESDSQSDCSNAIRSAATRIQRNSCRVFSESDRRGAREDHPPCRIRTSAGIDGKNERSQSRMVEG